MAKLYPWMDIYTKYHLEVSILPVLAIQTDHKLQIRLNVFFEGLFQAYDELCYTF